MVQYSDDQYTEAGVQWASFKQPGDFVEGRVVEYNATTGAKDFNGAECGHIDLLDDLGSTWRVELSKQALKEPIAQSRPVVGRQMKIVFAEWKESLKNKGVQWKRFRVFSIPNSEHDDWAYSEHPHIAEEREERQQANQNGPQSVQGQQAHSQHRQRTQTQQGATGGLQSASLGRQGQGQHVQQAADPDDLPL